MNESGLETPRRKRPRSNPSSSSSSRHVNKRIRTNTISSPSPKTVRFDPIGYEEEAILESDVPESPIALKNGSTLTVSFENIPLRTPTVEIDDPFTKLNLKSSTQKTNLNTPVATKTNTDGSKSVKKSARKTPGSAKANRALPFRIKVVLNICAKSSLPLPRLSNTL
jgi:hypothetical protein